MFHTIKKKINIPYLVTFCLSLFAFSVCNAQAVNLLPTGQVRAVGINGETVGFGDDYPMIGGYVYDDVDNDDFYQERAALRVKCGTTTLADFAISHTNKFNDSSLIDDCYNFGVAGNPDAGYCSFKLDVSSCVNTVASGQTASIRIFAVDPDTSEEQELSGSPVSIKRINSSCSFFDNITYATRTFNRASNRNQVQYFCRPDSGTDDGYALNYFLSGVDYRVYFKDAWVANSSWSALHDGQFLGVDNFNNSTKRNINTNTGYYYYTVKVEKQYNKGDVVNLPEGAIADSRMKKCAYVVQDQADAGTNNPAIPSDDLMNNLNNSYAFYDPFCAAIGASSTSVSSGDAVTIYWQVENRGTGYVYLYSSNSASPIATLSGSSGTHTVYPTSTTSYTLQFLRGADRSSISLAVPIESYVTINVIAPTIPTSPSNLTCSSDCDSVALNWQDNSTNETGFNVYRGGVLIPPTPTVSSTTSATTGTSYNYENSGLSSGTAYNYCVKAYNASGESVCTNVDCTTDSLSYVCSPGTCDTPCGGTATTQCYDSCTGGTVSNSTPGCPAGCVINCSPCEPESNTEPDHTTINWKEVIPD